MERLRKGNAGVEKGRGVAVSRVKSKVEVEEVTGKLRALNPVRHVTCYQRDAGVWGCYRVHFSKGRHCF